ncbi:hypothetical protein SAMN05880573_10775 [Chryseobacterium sp. RU33C]|nr:hypothetical protein SAMN05880573_10775 [Chryseobacterium sp. RU33C]
MINKYDSGTQNSEKQSKLLKLNGKGVFLFKNPVKIQKDYLSISSWGFVLAKFMKTLD